MTKQCILWLTTAAVFLVTSTSAVPVIDDFQNDDPRPVTQCAVTCPDLSDAKFQYTAGKTYEYTYESDIKTTIAGTASEHSSLHMRATVLVDVISTCEMNLRLTDVSLQDSDPTNYENRQHVRDLQQFKKALQDKAMSFAFIDGQIESICPRSDDETWAVNVRRGILSTLQNTMAKLQGISKDREIDISGNCPVKYEVIATSGQTIKVKKTKDLLGCVNRHDTQTMFQGMPYNADSDIQSMPLIASTFVCEQEINVRSRVIVKSTCTEKHAFRPFAKWNSGATTDVTYKMTFRRATDYSQRSDGARRIRSTMLFDHTMSAQQTAETLRSAQQTLQILCQKTQTDVRPEVPGLFTKLVHQMRRLDTPSLRQLMTALKGSSMCKKAEKFYRDSLPLLGTTAAVSTMRQLIKDNQVTEDETDVWMSALAFIKDPTKEMIREVKSLVELNMQKAALPVSSLINTYCQLNDDQSSSADVTQIVKLFEDTLKFNCRSTSDEETGKMLTALRAIGNAGLGAQSTIPALTRCANNDMAPMSIRVAAVNAFRRIDCNINNRKDLFKLLENRELDSELRINAYLAVMQCASEDTLQRVQAVLESDEVNQVLSFIWTHLTNLRETASPLKQEIRAILENAELKKEFNMDKRKFSRNIELSTFSELLNVGGTVESNLIWSGQSFVPRSASLNLTVDMFGRSINLVEFGGRIQGVEDLLERLLGPGSDLDNAIAANKRDRRAPVRDDVLSTIDRTFDKQPDSDQLSYYVRVFGNEIRAGDIFVFDLEAFKSKFNYLDWLIELAKDHNYDITKSFHFLDANIVIPTGTGFALRLNAEGSATIGLSAKGKVDVRQMFSSPSTFDINGSVKPSAAIEVRASMGIDGQVAATGLKLVNTLHSSTVLDGVLQLREGRMFNLDWNLPQDKVEIFNAESHVYVVYRDDDREQRLADGQTFDWKKCTDRNAAEKIGLEMCGELSVPRLGSSSLGPAVARLYINKLETYKGLHFDASYVQSQADGVDTVRVSFNTPESRIDRELTAILMIKRPQQQIELQVKTPWKRVNVEGGLVNQPQLKKATLKAVLDGTTEYSADAELQIAVNDRQERKYTPKLRIVIPDRPTIQLDGVINITPKRYDVKLALKNAFRDPITTDGWIQIVDKKTSVKYDVSMQITAPYFKGNLTGYTSKTVDNAMKTWASRAVLQYSYRGGSREQIIINHKIRDQSVSNLKTYSTDCSWSSTLWPRYNGQAGVELSYSANSIRTKVEAGLDDVRKVTVIVSGAQDLWNRDKKLNGLMKVTVPFKSWNYELKVDHIHNSDMMQTNATVHYGNPGPQQQTGTVDIGLRREGVHPLSLYGEAKLKYPGREMMISDSLVERSPREYSNIAVVQWQRNSQVRIESTYKMQQRHEMTNEITATGLSQPIRINAHVQPNLKNAQGRLEIVCAGKTYMADGSWTFRGTINQFNARANGQVSIAEKGASVTGEASRRDQEIGGNLEVIVNGNQRYAVNTQVTASMTTPKFDTRVEWPGNNNVQLIGIGRYEQQNWQSTSKDMEGSLKLTSSLEPIREIGVSFVYDRTTNGCKTNGEVTWAPGKKISGEIVADPAKVTMTFSTPFSGYRSIKGEATYSLRGRTGSMNAKLAWDNGKQIVLTMAGDASQPERLITAKITFNSPFRAFESLASNFRYSTASDRRTVNADFSWARGQQVAMTLTVNHQQNGWYITNNGEMTVTTPFNGMRNSRLRWQHQNNADSFKCKHDIDVDGRKFAIDVDTMHRLSGTTRRVTGRVSFQCPILVDWLQNASVSLDYQHDMRAIKAVGKSELMYGRYKFGHEHDINIDPTSAVIIKAKLMTPFQPIQEIGFSTNSRRQGDMCTTNNELIMGSHGKIGLDGSYQRNGYTLDASTTLTTPYRRLERLSVSVKNQQQRDGAWVANANVDYANDKQIAITGKLGIQSAQKAFEVEIRSPCPHLRQARAAAGFSGTARNFQASVELSHNSMGRNKITAALSVNSADLRNMNLQLTTRTPFADFTSFKVTGRHIQDSEEHTSTTATWELNRYRGSALVDMKARSLADFDGRYELEYTTGRKLELTTSFKVDPKIVATASFRSPFEPIRSVTASFNQEGPLDNFRMSADVTHNTVNRYSTGLDFTVRRGSIRTSYRLTTPHSRVQRVTAAFNLEGQPTQFNLDTSFELNSQKLSETMQFRLADGPAVTLKGKVETPFELLRSLIYEFNHNGPARNFNNNLLLNVNDATTTASSEFRLDGPSVKFELKTPYQPITQISMAHTTKPGRTFSGWQNNAVLEIKGRRYTGESSMGWRGKELTVRAVANVPEVYSIQITHKPDSVNNFNTTVEIRMADRTINSNIGLKTNLPALIDFKANLETNYAGYERFDATFKHEGSQVGFKSAATLTTPLRQIPRISAELTQRFTSQTDFITTLKMQLPLESVRQVTATLNHRGNVQDLSSSVTLAVDDKSMTGSLTFKNNRRATEGTFTVQTPFQQMSRFSCEYRHSGENAMNFIINGKVEYTSSVLPSTFSSTVVRLEHNANSQTQFKTMAELTIPAGKHSAALEHSGDPANFRSSVKVVTPGYLGKGTDNYEATIEHQTSNNPRTSVTIRGPTSYQLTLSKTGTATNLQVSGEVRTPIRGMGRTAASWSHNANWPTLIEARGTIETSIAGWERTSASMSHTGASLNDFRTTAALETSQRGYESMTAVMSNVMDRNGGVKTSAEITKPNSKIALSSDLSFRGRGWRWQSNVEMPIRGYEKWTGSVDHSPMTNGFKTSVQVNTPIAKYQAFGATITHSSTSANGIQTSMRLTTPCPVAPQIDIVLSHRGTSPTDFATSLTAEYGNNKRVEASISYKNIVSRGERSYEGSAKLVTTICPSFQNFMITASHNRKTDLKSGAFVVTLNGEKQVDLDYSYTTEGDRSININIRSPYQLATEMNVGGNGQGSATVNWDQRKIRFDFGLKNVVTSAMTDRSLTFRVNIPNFRRTVGFGAGYSLSADRFTNRGELYWDSDNHPEFLYDIDVSAKRTGYEGRLKVASALFNTDSSFSHRITGRRYKTDIVLNAAERLTIKSDLDLTASNAFTHTLTASHPKFSKDVVLTTVGSSSGFKSTLEYEQQSWILESNMKDDSSNSGSKRSAIIRFANPNSGLDVQLLVDYATSISERTTTGGVAIKYYMSRDRQMKTLAALRTEINKLRKEIKLELDTPIDSVRFSTTNRELDLDSGIIRYDVNYECSHLFLRSVFDFSRPDRNFDIKLYTAPDYYVEAYAQALSPALMNFEVLHANGDNRVTDIQLSTSFSESDRLLTGRSFVRPELSNDIRSYLDQAKSRMSAQKARLTQEVDMFVATMQADGRLKSRSLQQAVVVPVTAVASYVSSEIKNKANQVTTTINTMYRDNEFYVRDIHQALKRHYEDISRRLSYSTASLRRSYAEWSEKVSDQLDEMSDALSRWSDNLQQRTSRYMAGVSARLQTIQPDFDKIRPHIDRAIETVKDKLTLFFDNLRQSKSFRHFMDRLATMHPNDFIVPPSQWQSKLEAIADKIDQWLQEVLSKPEIHYARDWVVKSMQNNNWLYKLLGLEQQVNEWIAQLRTMSWETVKIKIREYANQYLKLDQTKWTEWDPRRGVYSFQVYVPFELPDLRFLNRFDPRPAISRAKNWVVSQMPDDETSILDVLYAYKPPSDIRDWVPPFKSHASLTGAQHYMTFDRRFFEFAGDCSYLLARDFIGGTFSVIVNYDRTARNQPVKKSLTVVSGGRQIEIYPDAKVTVDGSRVEMPVNVGNTTVMRRGNLISVTDSWRGLDVTCDLPHDHCILAVSGWYYGKTAGLFGTYDNEPSNDFLQIDKKTTTLPEAVADSWTVGQRCRPNNRAVVVRPETTTRRYQACATLFSNSRSMFRSCFKTVDPSSHMTMCLNDAPSGDNSLEAQMDVCKSAAAYVHECRRRDVILRMPKECVRCEVPNTNRVFYELDRITLDNENDIPRAADVVFVIQHAPCNRGVTDKISGLADSIEKALKADGITSARFAVVGFGGKMSHLGDAHVHTMDGQIFNSAKKLSLAVDNFNTESGTNTDAMVALRYTARLPFRAGASKTVILIGCDACRENTVRYSDVQRILLNNDIHLHVLVQDTIKLKSKSPKTAYIYGTDQQTVYTRRDVAGDELIGEPDLRRYISLPKDLCVALTMDTDGSVFSVRHLVDSRPLIQKQFIDVMTRTWARKALPTSCQICECLADEALVGNSQCQSCFRREPIYYLPPSFEDDETDAESTPSSPAEPIDNNSKFTVTQAVPVVSVRPQPIPSRRPVPVRPTRRPITPPPRVSRRPMVTRPPPRPRVPPRQQ